MDVSHSGSNPYSAASQRYRQVQVQTASKDELLMLLLDGGVRFAEGALLEMQKGPGHDVALRNDQLVRSQKILLELMGSLSPALGMELFQRLQGLYRFTFERLFEGNVRGSVQFVEEGVKIFKEVHSLWKDAVEKARAERSIKPDQPAAESTISVQG